MKSGVRGFKIGVVVDGEEDDEFVLMKISQPKALASKKEMPVAINNFYIPFLPFNLFIIPILPLFVFALTSPYNSNKKIIIMTITKNIIPPFYLFI